MGINEGNYENDRTVGIAADEVRAGREALAREGTWQQRVDALFAQDTSLSFDRLRAANVRRCEEVFHPVKAWSPTDWATALAGEVGEACNEIKKLRRLDGADAVLDTLQEREAIRVRVGRELADVIAYADLLAARMGIDLGAAVIAKFNEVSKKRNSSVFL